MEADNNNNVKVAHGRILHNRAQCNKCGEIVESVHRHDFRFCKCGAIAVDGGREYLRRIGDMADCKELSEYSE